MTGPTNGGSSNTNKNDARRLSIENDEIATFVCLWTFYSTHFYSLFLYVLSLFTWLFLYVDRFQKKFSFELLTSDPAISNLHISFFVYYFFDSFNPLWYSNKPVTDTFLEKSWTTSFLLNTNMLYGKLIYFI